MIIYIVQENETRKIYQWTQEEILDYINADRSADWSDYNESDVMEGWINWCQGESYNLITIAEAYREVEKLR